MAFLRVAREWLVWPAIAATLASCATATGGSERAFSKGSRFSKAMRVWDSECEYADVGYLQRTMPKGPSRCLVSPEVEEMVRRAAMRPLVTTPGSGVPYPNMWLRVEPSADGIWHVTHGALRPQSASAWRRLVWPDRLESVASGTTVDYHRVQKCPDRWPRKDRGTALADGEPSCVETCMQDHVDELRVVAAEQVVLEIKRPVLIEPEVEALFTGRGGGVILVKARTGMPANVPAMLSVELFGGGQVEYELPAPESEPCYLMLEPGKGRRFLPRATVTTPFGYTGLASAEGLPPRKEQDADLWGNLAAEDFAQLIRAHQRWFSEGNREMRRRARLREWTADRSGLHPWMRDSHEVYCPNPPDSPARARLDGVDLTAMALDGVDLPGADLRGARLAGVSLDESELCRADLHGADLRGVHSRLVILWRAELGAVDARAATLWGRFDGADFAHADLRDAVLGGVLIEINFTGADLRGAWLEGNVSKANFTDANLSGADLSSTRGLDNSQLVSACGDGRTRLPAGLSVPACGGSER